MTKKKKKDSNLSAAMDIYAVSFESEACDAYFKWLKEQITGSETADIEEYDILVTTMSIMPFTYVVDMDSNRMWDGLYLRNIFYDDHAEFEGELTQECSLLEALVGLAYRMSFDVFSDMGKSTADWFWEFMENLGATFYTDAVLEGRFVDSEENYRGELIDLLKGFMDRTYKDTRHGNVFKYKRDRKDIKQVELWYQMHYYIEEKYGF